MSRDRPWVKADIAEPARYDILEVMAEPLPIDTELCGLVWTVVDEARQSFHKHRKEGKYVAEDFRTAEIRQFESGFPNLGRAAGHVRGLLITRNALASMDASRRFLSGHA
jgi:hypothetical protein